MIYVEFLRARKSFIVFVIIAAIVSTVVSASLFNVVHAMLGGTANVSVDSGAVVVGSAHAGTGDSARKVHEAFADAAFPVSLLLTIGGIFALVYSTVLGVSLNKENDRGGFAFTKPISRERLALSYFLVDGVGIFALMLSVALIALAPIAVLGLIGRVYLDSDVAIVLLRSLGAAVMFYGMLQALSSSRRDRAGLVIAGMWIAAVLVPFLLQFDVFGSLVHGILTGLLYLDPLAYSGSLTTTDNGHTETTRTALAFTPALSIAVSWAIGIAGCALAIAGWKRVEV